MRRQKRISDYHNKILQQNKKSMEINYNSVKNNLLNSASASISTQLDKKIGSTRMSQSMLFQKNKINLLSISSNSKQSPTKRQIYSTNKFNKKSYNQIVRLPTLKKSSPILTNPQEKFSFSFKGTSPNKKKITQKVTYYQSLLYRSLVLEQANYLNILTKQHFLQTIQALKIGKFIKLPTPTKEIKLSKKNPSHKTIFLDLDQTLIHCDQNSNSYTVKLQFPIEGGQKIAAGIRVRPHCMEFLEQMSKHAELIIFTASNESYADVVLNYLDPNKKIFAHRLYRQNCTIQKGYYIKDLRIVNRRLQDSVLVDNSGYCFMTQPYNGIPIAPYYHYAKDRQLLNLIPFLKEILEADDVRIPIKNTFFWNKYLENDNDPTKIFQQNFEEPTL